MHNFKQLKKEQFDILEICIATFVAESYMKIRQIIPLLFVLLGHSMKVHLA